MKRDKINGAIGVVLGILLIIGAQNLPASKVPGDIGPAIFPMIAAVMIIIPGLFLVLKKPTGEDTVFLTKEEWKRFGVLIAVFFLYAVCLWAAGFLIATPIITFNISKMFSQGKKVPFWQIALYAVVLTLLVYLCFYTGLGLKLPKGEFINLEI